MQFAYPSIFTSRHQIPWKCFPEGYESWYNHTVSMGKDDNRTVDNNGKKAAKNWFKLDNAGKLYPAIKNSRWTSLFRVSVAFLEPVDPVALQLAVNDILPRFPSFAVRLRKGLFWYYLEENNAPFSILKDEGHPCIRMRWNENCGYLFRVLYHDCRISLEVFHAISDGSGGIAFMKTLAAQYLRRRGVEVPATDGILDLNAEPDPQEVEDAYKRLPCSHRAKRKETVAYHLPATREVPHTLHLIAARISIQALKNEAKKHGVTITEYLTSVMIYVIYNVQQGGKRDKKAPVKVSVPVNMRNFFPSQTLRNFSFFINPGIDPRMGEYSFEEVLLQTHHFMRYHLNSKFLAAGVATNVASERNILIRISPLFLKNLIINGVFKRVGESGVSATLTNLGPIAFPKEMLSHIAHVEIVLGSASSGQCNCAAVSLGDEMNLVFSRNIRESALEREVLRFLVRAGIPVLVESNQE